MDTDIKKAHKRRLKHLQIRAALHGIDAPPEVLIEIEDIKRTLQDSKKISSNTLH
jgi:hypothetical protein